MLAICLAACMVAPEPTPTPEEMQGIRLTDGLDFGVSFEAVRQLWYMTSRNADSMRATVTANNHPEDVYRWEEEVRWRSRCWYLLDDVINCPNLTRERKLQSLAELKRLIGDEDYYAGRMPGPTPKYRIPLK